MDEVYIAGCGATAVGEHWELSLENLAYSAMLPALRDSAGAQPQAVYIGNLLASTVSQQSNLGVKLAHNARLSGMETFTVEAGEASGAAALRMGYLAVKSGYVDAALVVGVEKFSDMVGAKVDAILAQSTDFDFESMQGLTPLGVAGMLMRRYLDEYQADREAFAALPILAHANAVHNPKAMFRKAIDLESYKKAALVSDPLNLYDAAPYADGAAAVLLVNEKVLQEKNIPQAVKIAASSMAVDTLALHDRADVLAFDAAAHSAQQALSKAGMDWEAIDLFELWDATSIYGVLVLEACGLAERGQGWRWLTENDLSSKGKLPLLSMGGNKARGFPLGAAGVYQVVEAMQQLRGQAGENQVPGARTALVQALGGPASTAVTHILTMKA